MTGERWHPTPREDPAAYPLHDLVASDAQMAGARTLASLVADRGRLWTFEHDGAPFGVMTPGDPRKEALKLLADALVRMKQAHLRRTDRQAAIQYEALLMIAGGVSGVVSSTAYRGAA